MTSFFNQTYWGNSILHYCLVMAAMLFAWLLWRLVKKRIVLLLRKLVTKTTTGFDDMLLRGIEKFIIPYAYLGINYQIINWLSLSAGMVKILTTAVLFVTVFFAIRLISFLVYSSVMVYMAQKNEPKERIHQLSGVFLVIKVLIWCIGIIMLIDNLGYDVTTIIAGFGIGGIAIALAAQNILGDLFSYFVIFFDKPFEIGDFIVVGGDSGIVEKIGIKTSHVRSIVGEQLIMPNSEMVKQVIHNYKRMERRRVVFSIGVVYYTSVSKLKSIPLLVNHVITQIEAASFERTHLTSFGDFSINFEIAYFIELSDYMVYLNTQHSVCIAIFEAFEKAGIEFAFPTQTIFVNQQNDNAKQPVGIAS